MLNFRSGSTNKELEVFEKYFHNSNSNYFTLTAVDIQVYYSSGMIVLNNSKNKFKCCHRMAWQSKKKNI